jgi:hypothetical protein
VSAGGPGQTHVVVDLVGFLIGIGAFEPRDGAADSSRRIRTASARIYRAWAETRR